MAIGNVSARKRGFGYDPVSRSLGVYVDGALAASFPPSPGRTYFVNNILGSSTNDGLSWANAMDQVSTAVTASETYRELGGVESGAAVTTNDYVRNTIMVQGTATAYTSITDSGEYVNIIGLGDPSGGRGYGVTPRLGADESNTTGGFESTSGTYNGVYFANMSFQTGDLSAAVDVGTINRSAFEDCTFTEMGPSAVPNAFFRINTGANGLTLRRCHTGGHAAITDRPSYGINIDGNVFAHCLVEDCVIGGTIAGFYVAATCIYGFGSVVKNNLIGDIGHGVMNIGIYDLCNSSLGTSGLITYVNNYIQATYPIKIYGQWERCIMNYADNAVITTGAAP